MRQGVDNGGADTEAGEGAGSRHEGDFGKVLEVFAIFLKFIVKEG